MKKLLLFLIVCFLSLCLMACGRDDSPISTTRPLPNQDVSTETTDDLNSTEDSTEDKRDDPEVVSQEIANMLRDAEALIDEGLYDDARMVLRDLRSRNLNDTERAKVNSLLSRLITISD